jgi:hypothetical protein
MKLLYRGKYKQRFDQVTPLLDGKSVVELCFGDVQVAHYCSRNHISWTGFDVNPAFVAYALKEGFQAQCTNLATIEALPQADICLMIGSLYHFHHEFEAILTKMLRCAPKVVLSEPVINLTNRQDWIGKLAGRSARITNKDESFRFTKASLLQMLTNYSKQLGFTYQVIKEFDKDLIVVLLPR